MRRYILNRNGVMVPVEIEETSFYDETDLQQAWLLVRDLYDRRAEYMNAKIIPPGQMPSRKMRKKKTEEC